MWAFTWIIWKRTWDTTSTIEYWLLINSDYKLRLNTCNWSITNALDSISALTQWVWVHIVATWDNWDYKIYINTVLDNSSTWGINAQASTNAINIWSRTWSTAWFVWDIDEIWIWGTTLSASQVAMLYNSGAWISYDEFNSL